LVGAVVISRFSPLTQVSWSFAGMRAVQISSTALVFMGAALFVLELSVIRLLTHPRIRTIFWSNITENGGRY
jgi:hypothetical protein